MPYASIDAETGASPLRKRATKLYRPMNILQVHVEHKSRAQGQRNKTLFLEEQNIDKKEGSYLNGGTNYGYRSNTNLAHDDQGKKNYTNLSRKEQNFTD
jgi:hypothetical protein